MELTDNVHWRDRLQRDGALVSYGMGRRTAGTWRVQNGELCRDRGGDDRGCYQVWMTGRKVELRRPGSELGLDGVLERPASRPKP